VNGLPFADVRDFAGGHGGMPLHTDISDTQREGLSVLDACKIAGLGRTTIYEAIMRPKPKGDFWRDAKHKHKLLSKRQFLRAWNDAISQTGATAWLKAGRPPSKSNHRTK
jgi:transposase